MMSDAGFHALRAAINLARFDGIKSLSTIKEKLAQNGHTPEAVEEAVKYWANYEVSKS
ncbi:MAG TPA: hypothetical protein VJR26_09970 [Candidatus Acidoferrales bacterium]|nr:hypothetical protein [Candidatus Acidoferrales bacterium]